MFTYSGFYQILHLTTKSEGLEDNLSLLQYECFENCVDFFQIPAQRRTGHSLTSCNTTPPATPHRLFNPKWLTGSGNRSSLRSLDPPINYQKISYFYLIIPSMKTSKFQNSWQGALKWLTGSGKGSTSFFGAPVKFC